MKILFLVAEEHYFWWHRLPLARRMRELGAEVVVMTRVQQSPQALEEEGFSVIPWSLSRGSLNPFREIPTFFQVWGVYRRLRPDLVHHVAVKPVIYGGLAARLCGGLAGVNAITGLGYVFTRESWKLWPLRTLVLLLLRLALGGRNSRTICENRDDRKLLLEAGVVATEQARVVRSSGVDIHKFSPQPEPEGVPVVVLASRLLREKGVGEFVAAARLAKERGVAARFVLVGEPDPANPGSITQEELQSWTQARWVEWWGYQSDMARVYAQANVVCLPSYAEGVPVVLLEAGACGRAIVTADSPGCRDVVRPGENGLVVPVRDAEALAGAIFTLVGDAGLRRRMGACGRELVVKEFSHEKVVEETLEIYRELLGSRWAGLLAVEPS